MHLAAAARCGGQHAVLFDLCLVVEHRVWLLCAVPSNGQSCVAALQAAWTCMACAVFVTGLCGCLSVYTSHYSADALSGAWR
jgi:hypothetical protein